MQARCKIHPGSEAQWLVVAGPPFLLIWAMQRWEIVSHRSPLEDRYICPSPLSFCSAQEKLSLQPLSSLIQFEKIPVLKPCRTIPFKMAAAVLQPLQSLSINNEIMAPSPISPNASRHGRGRHGGSVAKGGKTRGRGYSIVDDRDGMISKALTWVLKRTIEEGEEQDEGEEKLVADSEGFVDCEELVRFPPQPNNPHTSLTRAHSSQHHTSHPFPSHSQNCNPLSPLQHPKPDSLSNSSQLPLMKKTSTRPTTWSA